MWIIQMIFIRSYLPLPEVSISLGPDLAVTVFPRRNHAEEKAPGSTGTKNTLIIAWLLVSHHYAVH